MDRHKKRTKTRTENAAAEGKSEENRRLEMALGRNDETRLEETWEGSAVKSKWKESDEYTDRGYENAEREYESTARSTEDIDTNEEDRGREERSAHKQEIEDC